MATDPNRAGPRRRRAVLGNEVFEILGRAIRDGQLRPGQLVRDVDLAARLGVSRTPVREALQRLERIGLVEISANRFTRVTTVDDTQRADAREYIVYTMGAALRMACRRADDEELAEALALFDEMAGASDRGDFPELVTRSIRFYERLTMATHNDVFRRVMGEASLLFQRNLEGWTPYLTDADARRESYRSLRAAIVARDDGAAERIFRRQHGLEP